MVYNTEHIEEQKRENKLQFRLIQCQQLFKKYFISKLTTTVTAKEEEEEQEEQKKTRNENKATHSHSHINVTYSNESNERHT